MRTNEDAQDRPGDEATVKQTASKDPEHEAAAKAAASRWELADQWRLAWRGLKWTAAGVITIGALVVVGQVFLFHQMFSQIHPVLGWAFVAAMAGLIIWLIGIPLFRFLKAPAIAEAPDVDLKSPNLPRADLLRRIEFDDAYLRTMAANPALRGHGAEAEKARVDLKALKDAVTPGGAQETVTILAEKLARFERERIAPLLVDLDKEIDGYIHKEALAVGSATAVSLNGSVDAFIVLWRNINMVSRISRLYYGRPSLRLSLLILRDVMAAVLLSRALDDVTDAAGEALGGLVTKLGGMVVGPMLDGSVNALMTTKLGYLAKKRCRSFDVWSEASARRAAMEVFDQVKRESSGLIGELVSLCGGFLGSASRAAGGVVDVAVDAAGRVLAAPRSAWSLVQDTFVKKPAKAPDS